MRFWGISEFFLKASKLVTKMSEHFLNISLWTNNVYQKLAIYRHIFKKYSKNKKFKNSHKNQNLKCAFHLDKIRIVKITNQVKFFAKMTNEVIKIIKFTNHAIKNVTITNHNIKIAKIEAKITNHELDIAKITNQVIKIVKITNQAIITYVYFQGVSRHCFILLFTMAFCFISHSRGMNHESQIMPPGKGQSCHHTKSWWPLSRVKNRRKRTEMKFLWGIGFYKFSMIKIKNLRKGE